MHEEYHHHKLKFILCLISNSKLLTTALTKIVRSSVMPSNVFCETLNTSLLLKRRNAVVHLDSIVGTSLTRLVHVLSMTDRRHGIQFTKFKFKLMFMIQVLFKGIKLDSWAWTHPICLMTPFKVGAAKV